MIEIGEYARNESGIYKIIGKYERRYSYDLCVQLGNFYTGEFEGEQYESRLKIGKLIDLIEVGDIIEINKEKYEVIYNESLDKLGVLMPNRNCLEIRHSALEHIFEKYENITILTKEQYMQNCYKIDTN